MIPEANGSDQQLVAKVTVSRKRTTNVKSPGIVVPAGLSWHGRAMATLIYAVVRSVAGTLRFSASDAPGLLTGHLPGNLIFCAWHNRLSVSLPIYNKFLRHRQPGCRLAALVSASKDGGLLARILELFGVQPVRGSSSRRGPQALLELTTWAERGFDLAITPDGPRGPTYVVQEGVMALAQLTGLPVVPVGYNFSPKMRLNSWDRFQIPFPFGRCEVFFGKPIYVPRDTNDQERAVLREELENGLKALTRD